MPFFDLFIKKVWTYDCSSNSCFFGNFGYFGILLGHFGFICFWCVYAWLVCVCVSLFGELSSDAFVVCLLSCSCVCVFLCVSLCFVWFEFMISWYYMCVVRVPLILAQTLATCNYCVLSRALLILPHTIRRALCLDTAWKLFRGSLWTRCKKYYGTWIALWHIHRCIYIYIYIHIHI